MARMAAQHAGNPWAAWAVYLAVPVEALLFCLFIACSAVGLVFAYIYVLFLQTLASALASVTEELLFREPERTRRLEAINDFKDKLYAGLAQVLAWLLVVDVDAAQEASIDRQGHASQHPAQPQQGRQQQQQQQQQQRTGPFSSPAQAPSHTPQQSPLRRTTSTSNSSSSRSTPAAGASSNSAQPPSSSSTVYPVSRQHQGNQQGQRQQQQQEPQSATAYTRDLRPHCQTASSSSTHTAGSQRGQPPLPMSTDDLEDRLEDLAQALAPSTSSTYTRRRAISKLCIQLEVLGANWGIKVAPFGSSVNGLLLVDSDVDLGVVEGSEPLHTMPPEQKRALLQHLAERIKEHGLAQDKEVEAVLAARVPLLRFASAQSGLQCDLTIQGPNGLVKSAVVKALTIACPLLPRLYRLVQHWAAEEEIDDPRQGGLNSTVLLLMLVFFLQQEDAFCPLLPPIRWLVQGSLGEVEDRQVKRPAGPLASMTGQLLEKHNMWRWSKDTSDPLDGLTRYTLEQAACWNAYMKRERGRLQLGRLLERFFTFWGKELHGWLDGGSRCTNTWHGHYSTGDWGVAGASYVFYIEDFSHRSDNAARTVRLWDSTSETAGKAVTIARAFEEAGALLAHQRRTMARSPSVEYARKVTKECMQLFGKEKVYKREQQQVGDVTRCCLVAETETVAAPAAAAVALLHT